MSSAQASSSSAAPPRYIDIGVNLLDSMYSGEYHGKSYHRRDLDAVLSRARKANVAAQIVTSGSLSESSKVLELCAQHDDLWATVGCHPTRTSEFDAHEGGSEAYLTALDDILARHSKRNGGKAIAIGECGLDYDRLHFSPKATQQPHFAAQLDLAIKHRLPLFLHSRASTDDFLEVVAPKLDELQSALSTGAPAPPTYPIERSHPSPAKRVGVVHSFTDSLSEMRKFLDSGFFIGVNGCSLKTDEQLATIRELPLDRLMLETDAPWCGMKASHASAKHKGEDWPAVKREKKDVAGNEDKLVKDRNEPCTIAQVAAVVAKLKGLEVGVVAEAAERNTRWLFGLE